MSDLGWKADGIQRALQAGGVPLDLYQRPGFTAGMAVRHANFGVGGSGFAVDRRDDLVADIEIIARDPLPPPR